MHWPLMVVSAVPQAPFVVHGRRVALRWAAASAAGLGDRRTFAFGLEKDSQPPVPTSDALESLPPNSALAFKRNWPAIQLGADFYVFELRSRVADPQRWDLVGSFVGTGGDTASSRLEREFLSPMTVLSLAFPPDAGGDSMASSLQVFRRAMGQLGKAAGSAPGPTAGPTSGEVAVAMGFWEDGRLALNDFYTALNEATGTERLVTIPVGGESYPRSKERYVQLIKDAALCRNRGGEALAGIWGQLMVYGTVPGVNPCGNVNLGNYFN
eukprot:CAMPEP_0119336498 /NCGR_PEP_ID=MMETSP1333-20130426/91972_1 /TAXON_ID=418940 /ORGANISM="Scyphosphaera apsteinii, Strain RCC1455" /LENGTH=267 /DNA_ID=CAMNT_0007347313 /DNA_START=13 /DNA_END=813 /DNA_ORIENTATION=-